MAAQFNGSGKNREMEALDLLLVGKSNEYKGRVLEYVRNAKVDANDPTFLLMAALGNLDVALVELPKEIDKGKKDLRQEIDKIANEFRSICQTAQQESQTQNEAVKTGLYKLQTKIDVFETAVKKLQTQIKVVEDAESRIKDRADEMSLALAKNTKELANSLNKIEEQELVKIWDIDNWKAQHWLLMIGTIIILLFLMFDSWQTHSALTQVMEDLRLTNQKLADISEQVGYDTVKLGRIEKHLGIKQTK